MLKFLISIIAIQVNLVASSNIALLSIKHSIYIIPINICEYLVSDYTVTLTSKINKNVNWKKATYNKENKQFNDLEFRI